MTLRQIIDGDRSKAYYFAGEDVELTGADVAFYIDGQDLDEVRTDIIAI